MFDIDNSGFISPEELRSVFTDSEHIIPDRIIESIMRIADTNGDGKISLEEFLNVMKNTDL
jgi:Ca2+-binding EF-hand superfamily protein